MGELRTRRIMVLSMLVLLLVGCAGGTSKQPARTEPEPMRAEDKVRLAESYFRAGRMADALSVLREAIDERPDNTMLHSAYGQYSFLAGRYDDAENALHRALEIDPHLTDAHNWLGVTYAELRRYDEAEMEYRTALQDPAYPSPQLVYMNLGLLFGAQGRDKEAIENLREAVGIDPKFYKAHYELAQALERTSRFEEAAREYEVARPEYETHGEYFYRLGFVYFRLSNAPKALENLYKCRRVAPGSPSAARADELIATLE